MRCASIAPFRGVIKRSVDGLRRSESAVKTIKKGVS
jgi:hypothetical protein